jgi:hypothetical protein
MSNTQAKAAANRRNGSAARPLHRTRAERDDGPLPEPVREMVSEQPWAMIGAAAGLGFALGAATRSSRLTGHVSQMLAATASGVATRLAITSLVQWLEPKLEEKR